MSVVKKRCLRCFVLIGMLFFLSLSLFGCTFNVDSYRPVKDDYYTILDYNVDIVVNEDKTMKISETITTEFYAYTNGIYRYIPIEQSIGVPNENGERDVKNYKNTISNFEVDASTGVEVIEEFESDGYMFYMLKMPTSLSSGVFTFKFSYDLNPGDDRDTTKDFFYQNIIGTGWDTDINHLTFSISFPKRVDFSKTSFYVGLFGENTTGTEVETMTKEENGRYILSGTYDKLLYGEALTIYLPLEEGYFEFTRSYVFDIILLVSFFVAILLFAILFFKNRKKEPIIDVVEFSAPDGLTPTEAGYIIDKQLYGKDISSLIVYWADKGYVKLEEKEKKIYAQKVQELPQNAKEHEKIFFSAFFNTDGPIDVAKSQFGGSLVGEKIRRSLNKEKGNYFNEKANKWYFLSVILLFILTVAYNARITLASVDSFAFFIKVIVSIILAGSLLWLMKIQMNEHRNSRKKQWLMRLLALILALACNAVFIFWAEGYNDPYFARVYFLTLTLLLFYIYPNLEQYTQKGRECLGKLRGLKQYILVTEKDRIEALANEQPEIFFHILPYAYALGVSDTYIKKFADVKVQDPSWAKFSDGMTVMAMMMILNKNILALSLSLNYTIAKNIVGSVARVASKVAVSKISGGGGFSGGGSGGGGGGRF